jgi:hypothetical protein
MTGELLSGLSDQMKTLSNLLAVLGSCWFFAKYCGLGIWKLVRTMQAAVKEFQGMRKDIQTLSGRVKSLEERAGIL